MHFRVTMNIVVLTLILGGSMCGGLSYVFAFTYIHQAGAQMMDSRMFKHKCNTEYDENAGAASFCARGCVTIARYHQYIEDDETCHALYREHFNCMHIL